jgi:hypothetical protein
MRKSILYCSRERLSIRLYYDCMVTFKHDRYTTIELLNRIQPAKVYFIVFEEARLLRKVSIFGTKKLELYL